MAAAAGTTATNAAGGAGVKKLDMGKLPDSSKSAADKAAPTDVAVVIFHLPDGKSVSEETFRTGWTIGYLKLQITEKHQFPYDRQELYLGDRKDTSTAADKQTTGTLTSVLSGGKSAMADPLTLLDYQIKPNNTAHIFIKLLTEQELAKKLKDEADDDAA